METTIMSPYSVEREREKESERQTHEAFESLPSHHLSQLAQALDSKPGQWPEMCYS